MKTHEKILVFCVAPLVMVLIVFVSVYTTNNKPSNSQIVHNQANTNATPNIEATPLNTNDVAAVVTASPEDTGRSAAKNAAKNATQRAANSNKSNVNTTVSFSPTPDNSPISSSSDEGFSGMFCMLLFLGVAVYFLPALNAMLNKHHNAGAITALNLLLGWTFIGWVVALVWSLTKPAPPQYPNHPPQR